MSSLPVSTEQQQHHQQQQQQQQQQRQVQLAKWRKSKWENWRIIR
jgi:hypothetical protein